MVFLVFMLSFPLITNNNITFEEQNAVDSYPLKSSGAYAEPFIHIDGTVANNWSDTLAEPWCSLKSGVYVIENITIDASSSPTGNGILINNSINEKFVIRNCTIFNADNGFFDSGILLENTSNGQLVNNTCFDNHQGIYLKNSENNNITENIIINNQYNGIYLDTACDKNNITVNMVNNNLYGIQLLSNCDDNIIEFNTANFNGDYGIFINNFISSSDNNHIINNTINENDRDGIYITSTNHNNTIINNTANNNLRYGIAAQNSLYLNLNGNTVNNNEVGLYMVDSLYCNVTENTIKNNNDIGIYLYFNSDDNLIKNNTVNGNELGIAIELSENNNITGNNLLDNDWCIYEIESSGNNIEFNDCSAPTVDLPIFIDGTATGVGAHNWTWVEQQSWFGGGLGTEQEPYFIENLKISGFGIFNLNGIEVLNSNVYFIIQGCQIYNARTAILLEGVNNSLIYNNNCSNNNRKGISLEINCLDNEITGNIFNDNDDGISLSLNCSDNRIMDNIISRNSQGIELSEDCNSNLVSGNTIYDNTGTGIFLYESDYNIITENIVTENQNNGIYLEEGCDYNDINSNDFILNNLGIELYYSDFNSITNNNVVNNSYSGIEIEVGNFNTIIGNTIANNTNFGIYIELDSNNNSIYLNLFLGNGLHAYDDGLHNKWNSSIIGNYWDNHTEPDADKDGIVDIPYTYIGGSAGSIDYLPISPYYPVIEGLDPVIIAFIITISIIGAIAGIIVILLILKKQGIISLERLKLPFKKE